MVLNIVTRVWERLARNGALCTSSVKSLMSGNYCLLRSRSVVYIRLHACQFILGPVPANDIHLRGVTGFTAGDFVC